MTDELLPVQNLTENTTFVLLYVTTSSQEEALRLGRLLIENKLAACTNILPQMVSQYVWEGACQESCESVLLVKTTSQLAEQVSETIQGAHSYDVPCVLRWSLDSLNPEYTAWLKSVMRGS